MAHAHATSSGPSALLMRIKPHLSIIHRITHESGISSDSGVSFSPSSATASASSSSERKETAPISLAPERRTDSPVPTLEVDDEQEAWADVLRSVRPIGDCLRTPRLRTALGQTDLASECLALLRLSTESPTPTPGIRIAQVELLRVLANLCIDHDENRARLLVHKAPQTIVSFLDRTLRSAPASARFDTPTLTLLRTATGALLNLQLDHVATRTALLNEHDLGVLSALASDSRVYTPNEWASTASSSHTSSNVEHEAEEKSRVKIGSSVASWAWRVVEEVCSIESEDATAVLPQASIAPLLVALQPYTSLPAAKTASGATFLSWTDEEVSDLIDADAEILQVAAELIEGCALDSALFRTRAVDASQLPVSGTEDHAWRSPLELMMAFFEGAAPPASWSGGVEGLPQPADLTASQEAVRAFGRYKAAVARAVVAVAGEDDNMALLFGGSPEEEISVGATGSKDAGKDAWFIETLKEWMKRDPKERDDLVSCAMLALGNLARKDSHCLALVHRHNLAPFSSTLLRRGESDIKVSHGLVGLLKNLSIPAANKPVIGALGVIPAVAPFLRREKDMVQPLQFGTVGLLKHLCAGELDNALRLVLPEQEAGKSQGVNENSAPRVAGDEGTLEALLALTRRTDDVPTRMEGTRVLVNVIKTLWSSSSSPAPSSGATDGVLSQSSSSAVPTDRSDARSRARTRLVRSDVTHALAEMVRGSPKYPVLVNEGVFGLTLVGSTVAGARLVAHSLLYEPERSPPSSPSPGADGGLPPALPRRRGTADSNASTSSQPPPPPPRSLDMVCNVLARRDARMPPQFAANACALLQAVFAAELSDVGAGGVSQSEANGKGGDEERREKKEGREAIKQLALGSKAALEHLRDEGPQEALEPARKALESLAKVLSA